MPPLLASCWRAASWAALASALVACGGGGGASSQAGCGVPSYVRVVEVATLPLGRAGQTDRCAEGGTLVELRSDSLGGSYGVRLAAHELAHAAGFSGHLGDPDCILYEVVFDYLPAPCPAELAFMQGVQGQLSVSDELASHPGVVQDAITYWNNALGRPLFVRLP